MIEHGIERTDLDYALALLMSGGEVRASGAARSLMGVLLEAGAVASREAVLITAGHCQCEALRFLLESGEPMSSLIAAALGDVASLPSLLAKADTKDIQDTFGLAIINRHLDAARMALEAGADVNGIFPVHSHGTALHQAAANDDGDMVTFLVTRGARLDVRDTLWDATALDWALHASNHIARAALERADMESKEQSRG